MIYKSGTSIDSIQEQLQPEISDFSKWRKSNKLSLNIGKTKSTVFIPSFRGKDDLRPKLTIDAVDLHYVNCYKYLGITIDNKLTFKQHMNQVIKNVAYRSYTMSRAKEYLPKFALLRIYKSYVLPIVDQGDILYDGQSKDHTDKLQKLQNRCLKMSMKLPMRTPTLDVHKLTKTPYLKVRRLAHIRNYAYKRSSSEKHVVEMPRQTRLAATPVLRYNLSKCKAYELSVLYKTAQCWNNLDTEVKRISDIDEFKSRTKSDLFSIIVEEV